MDIIVNRIEADKTVSVRSAACTTVFPSRLRIMLHIVSNDIIHIQLDPFAFILGRIRGQINSLRSLNQIKNREFRENKTENNCDDPHSNQKDIVSFGIFL